MLANKGQYYIDDRASKNNIFAFATLLTRILICPKTHASSDYLGRF